MAAISWNMTSYNTVRAEILARAAQGLGYDFDGYYGYQCWDLGANWFWNGGHDTFYTQNSFTGTGGAASYVLTTWTYPQAFAANSADPFEAVTDVTQIKRGDMIVWGSGSAIAVSGHNAFADEDYNNGKNTISALGQNQQDSNFETGHIPTLNEISKNGILGAFRYKPWAGGPGPEPPTPPTPGGAVLPPTNTKIVILKTALQRRKGRL